MNGLLELLTRPLMMDARYHEAMVKDVIADMNRCQTNAAMLAHLDPPNLPVQHVTAQGMLEPGESAREPGSVIAVVPLSGALTRHGMMGFFMRSVGTLEIGRQLRKLDADPTIGSIVLNIDSPGGTVFGTPELSDIVYSIREAGQTNVVATVDPMMASAATAIGTASSRVVSIPSGEAGSIGVIWSYADYTGFLEKEGIDVSVLRVPEKKARFSGVEPLSEEMEEHMQGEIQSSYEWFVGAMARNRGVESSVVEKQFGGGEMMPAEDAVKAGLIDGIGSIDEVLGEMLDDLEAKKRRRSRRAELAKAQRAVDLDALDTAPKTS